MFRNYYPLGYYYLAQDALVVVVGVVLTWVLTRSRFSLPGRFVRIGVPLLLTLPLVFLEYSVDEGIGRPGSQSIDAVGLDMGGVHYTILLLICLPWLVTVLAAAISRRRMTRAERARGSVQGGH